MNGTQGDGELNACFYASWPGLYDSWTGICSWNRTKCTKHDAKDAKTTGRRWPRRLRAPLWNNVDTFLERNYGIAEGYGHAMCVITPTVTRLRWPSSSKQQGRQYGMNCTQVFRAPIYTENCVCVFVWRDYMCPLFIQFVTRVSCILSLVIVLSLFNWDLEICFSPSVIINGWENGSFWLGERRFAEGGAVVWKCSRRGGYFVIYVVVLCRVGLLLVFV